jgi:hypothetical protein
MGRPLSPCPISPVTPQESARPDSKFDLTRREFMIPMRDGMKLHTEILVPRGAAGAPVYVARSRPVVSGRSGSVPVSSMRLGAQILPSDPGRPPCSRHLGTAAPDSPWNHRTNKFVGNSVAVPVIEPRCMFSWDCTNAIAGTRRVTSCRLPRLQPFSTLPTIDIRKVTRLACKSRPAPNPPIFHAPR